MTKIYCADVTCKFNDINGLCTLKKIALSFHSVNTLWEGRQEYHRCKTYQKSENIGQFEKYIGQKAEKKNENNND